MAERISFGKKPRTAKDTPPRGKPRTENALLTPAQIEKSLKELLDGVALIFVLRNDEVCSAHIAENGPRLAHAWRNMAETNASVRRVLSLLLVTGKYTEVIAATLAFAIPIAQHHGIYPSHWINPFSASDLERAASGMGNMGGNDVAPGSNGHSERSVGIVPE